MIRKIILGLVLFITMFMSVNSATIELTTCGGAILQANNNYLINLTNPTITSGTECFTLNNGPMSIVNFTQINDEIIINVTGSYSFFTTQEGSGSKQYNNLTFNNFNIKSTNQLNLKIFWKAQRSAGVPNTCATECYSFSDNVINNSEFEGFDYVFYAGIGLENMRINRNIFDDLFVTESGNFMFATGSTTGTKDCSDNTLINSVFLTSDYVLEAGPNICSFTDTIMDNVVLPELLISSGGFSSLTDYTQANKRQADANDDNIGDGDANVRITKTLFGITFMQDVVEGHDLIASSQDLILVPLSDENLTIVPPVIIATSTNNHTYAMYGLLTLQEQSVIDLGINSQIDCTILSSTFCDIDDLGNTDNTDTENDYRGMIQLRISDNLIKGVKFSGIQPLLNSSTHQWISNTQLENTLTDINIEDNWFYSENNYQILDTPLITFETESTINKPYIKLKVDSLTISGNLFESFGDENHSSEFLDIESTNPTTNLITQNNFSNLVVSPVEKSRMFDFNADTKFVNNWLSNNVLLSGTDITGLIPNATIGYLHTDAEVYYFNIGNFYEENVGCVDGDADGICDANYTSGNVTDFRPLASWPFDFASRILQAEFSSSTNFTVNITNVVENQTFNVATPTTGISFNFQQDSGFPDLVCNYLIDGNSEGSITNPNTSVQTLSIYPVGGWSNTTYTLQVSCANDFTTKSSVIVPFSVTVTETTPDPGVGSGGGPAVGLEGIANDITIDPDDIEGTTDSVIDFFSDSAGLIISIGIPAMIFILIIGGIMFVFTLIR